MTLGAVLLVHVAAPFLRLDRVPPLAVLASLLEPLGLYRLLVADEAALQRFRLYASGVGALAAVGLAMTVGLALAAPQADVSSSLLALGRPLLRRPALRLRQSRLDDRRRAHPRLPGRLVAPAAARSLAALVVFGTLDLIALGLVQRGFNLRTIVERLDFWQKGLLLAAETPFTGVGLGVESVQLAYRAAFQPAYPPFSHAHNIFVQALLEQGILGIAQPGPAERRAASTRCRAAATRRRPGSAPPAWPPAGGALALLTAGLTEIVALTTVGGALLFGLLGLLVATHDAARDLATSPTSRSRTPLQRMRPPVARACGIHASTQQLTTPGVACSLGKALRADGRDWSSLGLVVARMLARVPAWRGRSPRCRSSTPARRRSTEARSPTISAAPTRARALAWAGPCSSRRSPIDPAAASPGETSAWPSPRVATALAARRLADEARARTAPDDRDGLFGVGRAYAAAGAWTPPSPPGPRSALARSSCASAASSSRVQSWETGIAALVSAAQVGAPARPAADAISRAALAHGESTEAAIARSGAAGRRPADMVEYYARLQIAHLYRLDRRTRIGRAGAGRGRTRSSATSRSSSSVACSSVWRERYARGRGTRCVWVVEHPVEPPQPVPDGDDPRYWLAVVAGAARQAGRGRRDRPSRPRRPAAGAGLAAGAVPPAARRQPAGAREARRGAARRFRPASALAPADARLADGIRPGQGHARSARRHVPADRSTVRCLPGCWHVASGRGRRYPSLQYDEHLFSMLNDEPTGGRRYQDQVPAVARAVRRAGAAGRVVASAARWPTWRAS